LKISVNSFPLNVLKATRQQWIYAVLAIVLSIFVANGLWFFLPLLAFFYVRFPKNYWIFFLVFLASFGLLHLATRPVILPELADEPATYLAKILRVRRRNEERQTAIVEINEQLVFMTFRDVYPRIVPGQTVEIFGRLAPPSPPTVPHRFNFKDFLRNQGIHLTIHTSELAVVEANFSPWRFQYELADWIRGRFPPLTASYLQSFFLGLRDDMDEETMDIYDDLGILHVFAISGVHVTLLSGVVRDALKRVGLMDLFVDGVLIVFCLLFIFIAGGSVSIIRACAMAILAILNRKLKLGLSSFDIFAVVFIANFALNPLVIFSRGFQFSYWIAFVLICSRNALRGLNPWQSRLVIVYLARMASIPIAVSSGFEVNVTSYIANLVLVPLLMQIIIPALLVTIFLPPLAPLTDFLLQTFEDLNGFLQPILNLNVTFGAVSLPVVILLMALLLMSCYFFEVSKNQLIRLALIGLYFLVLEANRMLVPATTITFLDVGQGDAAIIRSPYQACTVVIDTGGDLSRINRDDPSIFANTLKPYLLGNGVRVIDFLILTHEHYDHLAEAIPLLNRFNVRQIIVSEANHDQQMLAIVAKANQLNIPIHTARPLDTFTCGNQVYTFIHDEVTNLDVNEDSLVMTVEVAGFNVLLTGDIGHASEAAVLANNHLSHVDIYQVAHHGSRYSNSLEFMEALNVKYAVVQAGRRNFFGHPHAELFEVVEELGVILLNNASHGTVSFRLQGGDYQIHVWSNE